jgi:hypothetical protein
MQMHVDPNKAYEDLSYEYRYYWDTANTRSYIIPRMEGMHYKAQLLEHISASSVRWTKGLARSHR